MIQYFPSLSGNPTLAGTKQYHFLIIAFLLQQSVRGLFKEETKLQTKTSPPSNEGYGWVELEVCDIFFGQAAFVLISLGRWLWPRFSG